VACESLEYPVEEDWRFALFPLWLCVFCVGKEDAEVGEVLPEITALASGIL
jgi:hypothetical protein